MKTLLIAALCAVGLSAYAQDYNIDTYRVFGKEHPGIYKHPASITELANGAASSNEPLGPFDAIALSR